MPSQAEVTKQRLHIVNSILLLIAIGAVATTLGILAQNNSEYCFLFVDRDDLLQNNSSAPCKLSLAAAIIGTIALAILGLIELLQLLFGVTIKSRIVALVLQLVLYVTAIISVVIATVTVSAGWGTTCSTFKDYGADCHDENTRFGSFDLREFTGAAVCAGLALIMTFLSIILFAIQKVHEDRERYIRGANRQQPPLTIAME